MLTAEVVDTERTAGEVRPSRNKTGWNHDAGNHKAGRGGVHGARAAVIARIRLPVRPEFAYYAVNHGRLRRSNGKCQPRQYRGPKYCATVFLKSPLETRMVEETECSGS